VFKNVLFQFWCEMTDWVLYEPLFISFFCTCTVLLHSFTGYLINEMLS